MAIQKTDKIWHNGKLINWDDATIHVMSHVIHYGSSVFEGIRCYDLPSGPAIFRAEEHMQRLLDSAKVYRIDVDFTREQIVKGMLETVGHNGAWPCYVRPIVLRGYGEAGVNPFNSPTEVYIINYPWGKYLGGEVRWVRRVRVVVDAAGAEHAAGDGQGGRELHEFAAHQDGSHCQRIRGRDCARIDGFVSEGSGENIFLVHQRQADHGAAGQLGAAGHHARFGAADCARLEHSDCGADDPTRDAVHCRRGVLHRDCGGGYADSLGRQDQGGQGRCGADHQGAAERVLRHRARREDRPPWLAHSGARGK